MRAVIKLFSKFDVKKKPRPMTGWRKTREDGKYYSIVEVLEDITHVLSEANER